MKPKTGPSLTDPVRYVKGVGPRKALLFEQLGVRTAWDLLNHFPFRVEDFSRFVPMDEVRPGDEVTVRGRVIRHSFVGSRRGGALRVALSDGRGLIHLVWYNMPYMYRSFPAGEPVLASGRAEWRRGGLEMAHPVWQIAPESTRGEIERGPVIPVYHSTAGLTSQAIHRIIREALKTYGKIVRPSVPEALLERRGYVSEGQAYADIHEPASAVTWQAARRTMAFREMLYLQIALLAMRREAQENPGPGAFRDFRMPDEFLRGLPFSPTSAQERAVADIRADTSGGKAMNRLLQGDVGSGKTVVAMFALFAGVANGFQGAFLAPTEILADQHRSTFINLSKNMVRMGFISGGTSAADRKNILAGLAEGEIDVLIGTHAMLEPDVRWKRLGVVVTDEQHRFGVRQRLKLPGSARLTPHVLVMSATPIPRSLALTLYGDLDISVIDVMPPGRKPARTVVLDGRGRQSAYGKVREEVAAGHQAYVVCPLIREGETGRKAAELVLEELREGYLRGLNLGLIHGDLPRKAVDETMSAFLRKEIQVLVSTTVIEVGIDVANATVMVIEDADSFGLATLHQLRGRVGRGQDQSFCYLVSSGGTETGQDRLKVMETLSDGFAVAEADLEQRGPGQFFGTQQHGLPEIKVGNLQLSLEVVSEAREEARNVLASLDSPSPDPGLVRLLNSVKARFGDLFSYGRSR
jgi:ATP-dependent DNA helicase RecG